MEIIRCQMLLIKHPESSLYWKNKVEQFLSIVESRIGNMQVHSDQDRDIIDNFIRILANVEVRNFIRDNERIYS